MLFAGVLFDEDDELERVTAFERVVVPPRFTDDEPPRPLDCVTALPRRVVDVPPCDDVTPPCDAGREGLDVTAVLRLEPEVGRDAAEPPSTPTLLLLTPPLPDVTFALPAELLTFEPELPREG